MFRGQFKAKDSYGNPSIYLKGDVVLHQGKIFECQNTTQNNPLQKPKNWKFTGLTENTISNDPPVNPVTGQIWTSLNGISYVWYQDDNGYQWIET